MVTAYIPFYVGAFAVLVLLALVLTLSVERIGATSRAQVEDHHFRVFKRWFLLGWGISVAADWLQGPYLYVLYSGYGFSRHEIAQLFLAGFVVSGVCGAFVGRLADSFGRGRACEVYCLMYIIACVSKHFDRYGILMIGRITGGIATSLLFSVFESWVVSEMLHTHKVAPDALGSLLGSMYFTSYCAAIATGLLSQGLVAITPMHDVPGAGALHWGGSTLPYDLSIVSLVAGLFIMHTRWQENFGEPSLNACAPLPKDWLVWVLGLVCAGFESSMYIFVFNFTPALPGQPMGLVFALFMIASMSGASVLGLLGKFKVHAADGLPFALLVATAALAIPCSVGFGFYPTVLAFIVFETMAGFYWPAIASVKGRVVPEDSRANVYNLYRVPLNAFVVVVLIQDLSLETSFACAAILLGIASCLSAVVAITLRWRERVCPVLGTSLSMQA